MKHTFGYRETWLDNAKGMIVGNWYGISVQTDTQFDTLVDTDSDESGFFLASASLNGSGSGIISGTTIPAGTELVGNYTTASVISGIAVLYYGKEDNLQEVNITYKGVTP